MPASRGWRAGGPATQALVFVAEQKLPSQLRRPNPQTPLLQERE